MCDTMVKLGDGAVLFAKSSDRDPNEAQLLAWHPARRNPSSARVRCTWLEIPEARETHATLLSRPFWMWGAEMGANEHGVVIGNEAVFTRVAVPAIGLTGMDLLRLALERATSAESAVSVIVELLGRFGQGGGCGHEDKSFRYSSSFLVADSSAAFVLETAGDRWDVERVHGARSISNALSSRQLRGFASPLETAVACGHGRAERTRVGLAGVESPAELATILRDHGGDRPRYRLLNGAMSAPCMHAGGAVVSSQTTASMIAELRPGSARVWMTGTAATCTSVFKPVSVGRPLDLGPPPTDRDDPRTLFWRHERLHRRALRDPARLFPLFVAERDELEARFFRDRPDPALAFAEASERLDGWTRRVASISDARDTRPIWTRRYWAARNARAGLDLDDVSAGSDRRRPSP